MQQGGRAAEPAIVGAGTCLSAGPVRWRSITLALLRGGSDSRIAGATRKRAHVMRQTVLRVLLLAGALGAVTTASAPGADWTATYQTVFGHLPRFVLDLRETSGTVSFTLQGAGLTIAGSGTRAGSTLALHASLGEGVTLSLALALAAEGQTFTGTWRLAGGPHAEGTITGTTAPWPTFDIDARDIPLLVGADCIELWKIARISRFRSGEGHDYSDDFETCRSMKHYYDPAPGVERTTVHLFSPVTGTVLGTTDEYDGTLWKGVAIGIRPDGYPAFDVVLFHVNLEPRLAVGSRVRAGQLLGTSAKQTGTVTDVALGVHTPQGYRLISFFQAMPEPLFACYAARGVVSRQQLVITREERDAAPLTCAGETFLTPGTLENWVTLAPAAPPRGPRRRLPARGSPPPLP